MKTFLTIAAALTVAIPAWAEEEVEIPMSEAPEAAVTTAMANAGGRSFEGVLKQIEEGVLMYEFIGTKDDGLGFAVEVYPDGTLFETAEEITIEQVPQVVLDAFASELPNFAPMLIEKNAREGGTLIVYEFEGELDGEDLEAYVHADGTNFSTVTEEDEG